MLNSPKSAIPTNSLIKGKYKLVKKIGQGAFGEIYSGKAIGTTGNELVAIKFEKVDVKKQVLKLEVAILRKLQESCAYVARFITCGRINDYNYMVMELLGENISELRRRQPLGKFTMPTTLRLGIQMITILESIHDMGYVHRDVKPSNFVLGLGSKKSNIYVIDFGLARRFVGPDGDVRPARDQTGFRGTARYASINSHLCRDLGRRDDLWSVFYILIESVKGYLPWRKLKDKDKIGELKIKLNTPELVRDLPSEFLVFMDHLQALEFTDRPDYAMLISLLEDLYTKAGGKIDTPFDWEINHTNILEASINLSDIGRINQDLAAEARQLRLLSNKRSGSIEPEGPDPPAWFSSGEPIGSPANNSREEKGDDSSESNDGAFNGGSSKDKSHDGAGPSNNRAPSIPADSKRSSNEPATQHEATKNSARQNSEHTSANNKDYVYEMKAVPATKPTTPRPNPTRQPESTKDKRQGCACVKTCAIM
jgi:tau tubulin kinase